VVGLVPHHTSTHRLVCRARLALGEWLLTTRVFFFHLHRFRNARDLVGHFSLFEHIKPESACLVSSRQLRKGFEGLILYISSLPRETIQEEWEWDGDTELIARCMEPFTHQAFLGIVHNDNESVPGWH